jgi:SpoVK/Ycf46/Vps4 family AAA+-type ATPase
MNPSGPCCVSSFTPTATTLSLVSGNVHGIFPARKQSLPFGRFGLASADWYQQIGVPYRRGYLLHGPPGNGKTSVVKALAGELGMNIYLLMLADGDMTDIRVNDLLAKVPARNMVLLEDVDCAFARRKKTSGKEGGLTFSGLLNAIDGVAAPEGRIIVMTTNHVEKLDPALVRPGRADVKLWFGNATADQARRLFERFFPSQEELARAFGDRIEDRQYSMATLQDYLMLHRRDAQEAVRRIGEMTRLAEKINSGSAGVPTPLPASPPLTPVRCLPPNANARTVIRKPSSAASEF